MKISLDWLNQHLSRPTDSEEASGVLTAMGFPVEAVDEVALAGGGRDTVLDVEVTANRGDCLSHRGMARELEAGRGAKVKGERLEAEGGEPPEAQAPSKSDSLSLSTPDLRLSVHRPDLCPLYTARVIRGVKVAPSPRWLVDRLQAIGLRAVNNVVDATNFILHEMGQPLHAFDLDRLAGGEIRVRWAKAGEAFKAIDGSEHELSEGMLVIADANQPAAIAGVMGGAGSEVGEATTAVALESAVFDPLSVRTTSRALKLASDASYRFERGVDPAGAEAASARAARLIVELAGGGASEKVIRVGEVDTRPREITMRLDRCNALLGLDLSAKQQAGYLARLGLAPNVDAGGQAEGAKGRGRTITCQAPSYRLDLQREVDLIEEVARCHGLDAIPLREKISLVARPPQPTVGARQDVARVLTAYGYHEAVTFSFVSEAQGEGFTPPGAEPIVLADERRKAEPMLRPSLVPSLLVCRKANQDAGNTGVRLYELGAAWARQEGETREMTRLTLLGDVNDSAAGLRELRGMVAELVKALAGPAAAVEIDPVDRPGYAIAASVRVGTQPLGFLGVLDAPTRDRFGLRQPVAAAELDLAAMIAMYPPRREAKPLPRFPAIQRDLSIVVDEAVAWREVVEAVEAAKPMLLEGVTFLGAYRGEPILPDAKSLSFRMLFRDPERTLRHEQVDPQVRAVVDHLKTQVGAELRA